MRFSCVTRDDPTLATRIQFDRVNTASATSEIQDDVLAEGERVLAAARAEGVPLRLVGGVAVWLRARDAVPHTLSREYKDLDFATTRKRAGDAQQLLRNLGYAPHVAFNTMNSKERLLFFDDPHERQVDVFVGSFRMSHEIPLEGRLEVDDVSVPLAELLLTKLQIVQLNEKDVRDTVAMLVAHDVGETDGATLNAPRVAQLCAADWGLWRTITKNLENVGAHLDGYDVDRDVIARRLAEIEERIEAEPKSRSWRLRGRIGERKRWYELPEEVGGGP
jgi:hypothetical protein